MRKLLLLILLLPLLAIGQTNLPKPDSIKLIAPPIVGNFTPANWYYRGANASNGEVGFFNTITGKWVTLTTGYQANKYLKFKGDTTANDGYVTHGYFNANNGGGDSTNIYNSDGALTGNRTVDVGNNHYLNIGDLSGNAAVLTINPNAGLTQIFSQNTNFSGTNTAALTITQAGSNLSFLNDMSGEVSIGLSLSGGLILKDNIKSVGIEGDKIFNGAIDGKSFLQKFKIDSIAKFKADSVLSGAGGSSFYQTVQANGTSRTQRANLNFLTEFNPVDNSGNNSTDISINTIAQSKITHLSDSLLSKINKADSLISYQTYKGLFTRGSTVWLKKSDTTAAFGNFLHKAGTETATGFKTFSVGQSSLYVNLTGATPATPSTGISLFSNTGTNALAYIAANGKVVTIRMDNLSASRVYQWPDSTGIIALENRIIPNSNLANSSTTINGTAIALGASGTVTAAAGTLTGTTLASGVTASSLTSVGTLGGLTVTAPIAGSVTGNAATVTTNANLTGEVTSVGNAATLTNSAVIGKVLTGYTSGAGTVSATDNILQAIQKLNGNISASLTNPMTAINQIIVGGTGGTPTALGAPTDSAWLHANNTTGAIEWIKNSIVFKSTHFKGLGTPSVPLDIQGKQDSLTGPGFVKMISGAPTYVTTLGVGDGGLGIGTTPTNGQIPIGNGTNYVAATITGTTNQVVVTNGGGSITLSLPQSINTTATPQLGRMGLGTAAIAGSDLKIAAGTTAISPIQLTSGTNTTTAVSGAIEYDGSFFYGTNSTPARGSFPLTYATADLTAQTAAGNITTFTVGATTRAFQISAYLNITVAGVTDVIETQVTYTDENSASQTVTLFNQGATSALLSAIGNSSYPPVIIRAKNATVITVKTTLTTGGGSITFDAGGRITQL